MSTKVIAFLTTLSLLTGCGFEPLHKSPQESQMTSSFKVDVKGMDGYVRHYFYYQLDKNLKNLSLKNKPQRLSVTLEETQKSTGYGRDATELRGQEKLKASYVLVYNDQEVLGELETSISYHNMSQDEYRNLASKKETQKRAIEELARDLVKEIKIRLDTKL